MLDGNFEEANKSTLDFMKRFSQLSQTPLTTMEGSNISAEALKQQIAATEKELRSLKDQLARVEAQAHDATKSAVEEPEKRSPVTQRKWPLSQEEYKRYGRQMIVPNVGIQGMNNEP